ISRRDAPELCGKRFALSLERARGTPDAERDQQKWAPVLRPVALLLNLRMALSPNRSHFGGPCVCVRSLMRKVKSARVSPLRKHRIHPAFRTRWASGLLRA